MLNDKEAASTVVAEETQRLRLHQSVTFVIQRNGTSADYSTGLSDANKKCKRWSHFQRCLLRVFPLKKERTKGNYRVSFPQDSLTHDAKTQHGIYSRFLNVVLPHRIGGISPGDRVGTNACTMARVLNRDAQGLRSTPSLVHHFQGTLKTRFECYDQYECE